MVMALTLSLGSAAALADPLKDRARQGKQLYKEGQYEDAAKVFSSLSVEYPDNHAFTRNLGACYYHLRRPEPAISNLREYLNRKGDIAKEDRTEVEGWIAEMEKVRDQAAAAGSVVPVVVAAPPSPAALAPATVAAATALPVATAPIAPAPAAETVASGPAPATTSDGRTLRIAGMATGAAGLVAIGTGIYFYTRATSLSDKITNSKNSSASDFASGKSAETMQWVFYSVGVAALATGSILYYLGWRDASPGQTAIAPMAGPGLAGIAAQGAF